MSEEMLTQVVSIEEEGKGSVTPECEVERTTTDATELSVKIASDALDEQSSVHSAISPIARRMLLGEDTDEDDLEEEEFEEFSGGDFSPRQLPLGVPLPYGDDDDSGKLHRAESQHSLPNVEELKASYRDSVEGGSGSIELALSKTKKRFLSFVFYAVVIAGLVLLFAFGARQSGKEKATSSYSESDMNDWHNTIIDDASSALIDDDDAMVATTTNNNDANNKETETFDDDFVEKPPQQVEPSAFIPEESLDDQSVSDTSQTEDLPAEPANPLTPITTESSVDNGIYIDRVSHLQNYLVKYGVVTEALEESSAQAKAIDWIANVDQEFEILPTHQQGLDTLLGYSLVTRYVMAVLYFGTDGPSWHKPLNFLDPKKKTCDWWQIFPPPMGQNGVLCNSNNEIVGLSMISNNLVGTLPTELSHIKTLSYLESIGNSLGGSIPSEWQQLVNMRTLVMAFNEHTGTIPSWMPLVWPKLEVLYLSNNDLTGTIPQEFFGFQNLSVLALDDNMLTGRVDVVWNSIPSLEYLYLEDNGFTGTLPRHMTTDSNNLSLVHVDLSSNRFTGSLSDDIFRLPQLEVLDLNDNQFYSSIPQDIPLNHENLQYVALQKNALSGSIPSMISNLRKLSHLDVANNQLTGTIPIQLERLTHSMSHLFLGANSFREAPIPSLVYAMTNLKELSLKSSNLKGTISEVIGALDSLWLLDLDDNRLSGSIPTEIGMLTNLQFLLLNRNQLTSQVPSESFKELSRLRMLLLDQNHLLGDLNPICGLEFLENAYVDCGEVACIEGCCFCCQDGQEEDCHDLDQVASQDPLWEAEYQRQFFDFSSGSSSSGEGGYKAVRDDDFWA